MSAVATEIGVKRDANTNKAMVVGKIDSIRKYSTRDSGDRFELRVVLPAEDEFSSPQVILIESDRKLGNVGDHLRQVVRIGGYRDSYKDKQGDTHLTARVKLYAVD